MREYSGQTLAELFQQQGPLPLAQWQSIAERLLRAVGMLHRRQILHRDIKPENLLLGKTANCGCWILAWPIAPAYPKTALTCCRAPQLYRARSLQRRTSDTAAGFVQRRREPVLPADRALSLR